MSDPIIRLDGVSKYFGTDPDTRVTGLDHVTLEIRRGEFVAIVGPSGGGKTTLMSILGLLDKPSAGEYHLHGLPTSMLSDADRTRLRGFHLGFIFQSFHLLDRRPVIDSVELGLLYQGLSPAARRERATQTMQSLGLGARTEAKAGALSGGQRQRVAIARALATGNPVLLADEPTGNLDSANGAAVIEELVRINELGRTVIVVTHSEEVASAARRRIHLADGRIVSDSGDTGEIGGTFVADESASGRSTRARPRVRGFIKDAARSVVSRGGQSVSLVLAVAIAVALVVISIGFGQSARAQVSDTFDRFANRDVSAEWVTTAGGVPDSEAALSTVAGIAGVRGAAVLIDRGESSVRNGDTSAAATRQGVAGDIGLASDARITLAQNGELADGAVLVGRTLAEQLSLAPLENSPMLVIDGTPLRVVGIIESSRRYPALLGQVLTTVSFGETKAEAKTTLAITAVNGAASQIGSQLQAALAPTNTSAVRVSVPVEVNTLRSSIESGLQIALAAFAVLSCLIAVFMLSNAISASVHARTGEFGLRRAVGARGSDLVKLVGVESILLGAMGGAGGLVVGLLVILGFTIVQGWVPVFNLVLAPFAIATGVIIAVMSSVVGCVRAALLRPAVALRA